MGPQPQKRCPLRWRRVTQRVEHAVMTTNDIKEFLGLDYSKNGQTLGLGHISQEEWASWLTHLGYRWQVQLSGPWGSDLHTDLESLLHTTLDEVRIVHSEKTATFREGVGHGKYRIEYRPVDAGKLTIRWAKTPEEAAEVMASLWKDMGTRAFISVTQ